MPRAVLLDIDGLLTRGVGGPAFDGGPEAVAAVAGRWPVRYLTNATSRTRRSIASHLAAEGYPARAETVFTPAALAQRVLPGRGHDRGILLADSGAAEDLAWFTPLDDPEHAPAVLLASECHDRRIADLQPAVRALRRGARLYALQANRVFRKDGRLWTDLGPVAAFLGYAADCGWESFGKPSPAAFEAAARDLGVGLGDLVMVGDDAEFDCAGALRAGVGAAILVRTGKYEPGDETRVEPSPTRVIDSVADLPDALAALG
ncbi:MAG: HAD family hydrolase [Acidobacteria bacterium]|nr:MAG: HAD family hydrolase [Acidobacteriota bacterium]